VSMRRKLDLFAGYRRRTREADLERELRAIGSLRIDVRIPREPMTKPGREDMNSPGSAALQNATAGLGRGHTRRRAVAYLSGQDSEGLSTEGPS
jgi:hypothetical protein